MISELATISSTNSFPKKLSELLFFLLGYVSLAFFVQISLCTNISVTVLIGQQQREKTLCKENLEEKPNFYLKSDKEEGGETP